jgi:hypothetical protein
VRVHARTSSVFFKSVFWPNHSMLGSHLKCFLIATLNSQSKESKLASTNSDSVFVTCSALLAASMTSFGRCIYERFSTSFNDAQKARFDASAHVHRCKCNVFLAQKRKNAFSPPPRMSQRADRPNCRFFRSTHIAHLRLSSRSLHLCVHHDGP